MKLIVISHKMGNLSVSYPDDTWTWEDFREAAKKLTKEDGSQYGTVLSPKSNHD